MTEFVQQWLRKLRQSRTIMNKLPSRIYSVEVYDIDDTLIYQSDVNPSSTILDLKLVLYKQSPFKVQPSEQLILFNDKRLSNSVTFQQIHQQNDSQTFIQLQVIQYQSPRSSVWSIYTIYINQYKL